MKNLRLRNAAIGALLLVLVLGLFGWERVARRSPNPDAIATSNPGDWSRTTHVTYPARGYWEFASAETGACLNVDFHTTVDYYLEVNDLTELAPISIPHYVTKFSDPTIQNMSVQATFLGVFDETSQKCVPSNENALQSMDLAISTPDIPCDGDSGRADAACPQGNFPIIQGSIPPAQGEEEREPIASLSGSTQGTLTLDLGRNYLVGLWSYPSEKPCLDLAIDAIITTSDGANNREYAVTEQSPIQLCVQHAAPTDVFPSFGPVDLASAEN